LREQGAGIRGQRGTRKSPAFKTPGLREVALHPPYMHDGSLATLAAVMEHYRKGGTPNPNLSAKMEPVTLSDGEVADLLAMMQALTADGPRETPPRVFP
jgi:cytochrome c peroxidase